MVEIAVVFKFSTTQQKTKARFIALTLFLDERLPGVIPVHLLYRHPLYRHLIYSHYTDRNQSHYTYSHYTDQKNYPLYRQKVVISYRLPLYRRILCITERVHGILFVIRHAKHEIRQLKVVTFAGRNFREFRVFQVFRESLYLRNRLKRSSANFLPQNGEKLHENKEIMPKNPSFAKFCTHET